MAHVHRVGVHHPGHGLLVRVHVGGGHVPLWAQEVEDLGGVAAGDALQFAFREQHWVADESALGAPERDVDDGAFPGHPGSEGAHFVECDVGSEPDASLARAASDRVLNAVAREYFHSPVVETDWDVDGDFLARSAENLSQPVVEPEAVGRFVEPCLCRESRIEFRFG